MRKFFIVSAFIGWLFCEVCPAAEPSTAGIDRAVQKGVAYLASRIDSHGRCIGEYPPNNPRHGGMTGLCLYAMLAGGAAADDPAVYRAADWLAAAELKGTYAVAMRTCAFAASGREELQGMLRDDVRWLVKAADENGRYTYTPASGPLEVYDNSNSQMAAMAVAAAMDSGIEIPHKYWQRVQKHWRSQQAVDGGWGYRRVQWIPRTKTYGSMTAAGVATMYVCFETLHGDQFVRCAESPQYEPIADGLKWLEDNFTASANPRKGITYYYYWLFCLQRVGRSSGMKRLGGHDWFAEAAAELLDRQNDDGSFSHGERTAQTALAVLFLARGGRPLVVNKLRWNGRWNARPRDAARLATFLSNTFERDLGWQIVDSDAPISDWREAPILYISGAGPWEPSREQVRRLRRFVLAGGMIVSEAACNNSDFSVDASRVYKKMLPEYPLEDLPREAPIYGLSFRPEGVGPLLGVSNGVRPLVVHSPRELSLALQLGPGRDRRAAFELLANAYLISTDKGRWTGRPGPWRGLKMPENFDPRAEVKLARLRYDGNYDPEPMAWRRLEMILARRHNIRLSVSGPVKMTDLDADRHPFAAMTGTDEFTLSEAQAAAMKEYLADGGTLIIDAAGGSRDFAVAFRRQILPLVEGGTDSPLAPSLVLDGPRPIEQVDYRPDYATTLGDRKHEMRLRAITRDGRAVIIYSRSDITAALAGVRSAGIRGYSPQTAAAMMTNLLCNLAGIDKR